MKIIEQSAQWERCPHPSDLSFIESAGRICYKSDSKGNPEEFVRKLIKSGHESVLEHVIASIRLITSRNVTHELVRHRLCAYSQESTRYVNYTSGIELIRPVWFDKATPSQKHEYMASWEESEATYVDLIELGQTPQQAREVLPGALKTEIVVTANIREWRHILKLRTNKKAHPQIRALMLIVLDMFMKKIPVCFEDINEK